MTINIMIKTLEGAYHPDMATEGSAGYDLAAYEDTVIYSEGPSRVRTGIYLEIPLGHVGLLIERSSLYTKSLTLANNIGVIDSDYRGEIMVAIAPLFNRGQVTIEKGQRIAQLVIVPIPRINLINVSDVHETTRNTGGFGSSGD